MSSDAIFGLVGVIVGGTLTGAVEVVVENRRQKRRGRAAARLVHDALRSVQTFVEASLEEGEWLDDPAEVLLNEDWIEQRSTLAEAPGFDGWYPVSSAWNFIAALRRGVNLIGEKAGDDPAKERQEEFFSVGQMIMAVALQALEAYAATASYQVRNGED